MFNRNTATSDYLTRDEASKVVADLKTEARGAFVTQEDAAAYSQMLNALDARVQELENLASELRRGGSAASLPTRTPGATTSAALTKSDAEGAMRQLRNEVAEQFALLGRKIDAQRSVSRPEAPVVGGSTGVDYGAVAFGLSEIARKVRGAVGAHGFGGSEAMADYYRETVQYFADVFAKSDTEFDADAFKRQSGV